MRFHRFQIPAAIAGLALITAMMSEPTYSKEIPGVGIEEYNSAPTKNHLQSPSSVKKVIEKIEQSISPCIPLPHVGPIGAPTVICHYDAYLVAQVLRRQFSAYRGGRYSGAFDLASGWSDMAPDYKAAAGLYVDGGGGFNEEDRLDLGHGIDAPLGHLFAALSFQFGHLVNAQPSDNSYGGDLGSVIGAFHIPNEWAKYNNPGKLNALCNPQERWDEAFTQKMPDDQKQADILAHVMGLLINSENKKISDAITDVAGMSPTQRYDRFLTAEFGNRLSDLHSPQKRSFIEAKAEDRVASFIPRFIASCNAISSAGLGCGHFTPFTPTRSELKTAVDHFLEYIEANGSRPTIQTRSTTPAPCAQEAPSRLGR